MMNSRVRRKILIRFILIGPNMKLLIFGAFGFLGQNIIAELEKINKKVFSKLSVTYFSNSKFYSLSNEADFFDIYECDVRNKNSVEDIINITTPDVILHMASTRYFSEPRNQNDHADINLLGLKNIIDGMKVCGLDSRLIFINSGAAKNAYIKDIGENYATKGLTYVQSKLLASNYFQEKNVTNQISGLEVRLFTPFGPWDYSNRLIQSTVIQLNSGKIPKIHSPESTRDFIHVSDVVNALINVISNQQTSKKVLEIGTSKSRSVLSVVKNIYKIMNVKYVEDFHSERTENEEITSMEADINYSKELLDWMPRILFEDGLESTVKWTLNQIGRFYD